MGRKSGLLNNFQNSRLRLNEKKVKKISRNESPLSKADLTSPLRTKVGEIRLQKARLTNILSQATRVDTIFPLPGPAANPVSPPEHTPEIELTTELGDILTTQDGVYLTTQ